MDSLNIGDTVRFFPKKGKVYKVVGFDLPLPNTGGETYIILKSERRVLLYRNIDKKLFLSTGQCFDGNIFLGNARHICKRHIDVKNKEVGI